MNNELGTLTLEYNILQNVCTIINGWNAYIHAIEYIEINLLIYSTWKT